MQFIKSVLNKILNKQVIKFYKSRIEFISILALLFSILKLCLIDIVLTEIAMKRANATRKDDESPRA